MRLDQLAGLWPILQVAASLGLALLLWVAKDKLGSIASALASVMAKLDALGERVSGHSTQIEVALLRVENLETVRITKIETEIGNLREKLHALANELQVIKTRKVGRG